MNLRNFFKLKDDDPFEELNKIFSEYDAMDEMVAVDQGSGASVSLGQPQYIKRFFHNFRLVAIGAAALGALALVGVVTYWAFEAFFTEESTIPFVFIEVRVLDPDGRSVAGAKVKLGDEIEGVTDSFGEWRRYLRIPLGSRLPLLVVKDATKGQLGAHRMVNIPVKLPKEGDLEMKVGLTLQSRFKVSSEENIPVKKMKTAKKTAEDEIDPDDADFGHAPIKSDEKLGFNGEDQKNEPYQQKETLEEQLADEHKMIDEAEVINEHGWTRKELKRKKEPAASKGRELQGSQKHPRDELSPQQNKTKEMTRQTAMLQEDHSAIAISLANSDMKKLTPEQLKEYEELENYVFPALRLRAKSVGLILNPRAALQLKLAYIPVKDAPGFLRGDASWQRFDKREEVSFLRGQLSSAEETAANLMNMLRLHVTKSYFAYNEMGKWYVLQTKGGKGLWGLQPGDILADDEQRYFSVTLDGSRGGQKRFSLIASDDEPCANETEVDHCILYSTTIHSSPPVAGWKPLKLIIAGEMPAGAEVFVSGYLANRIKPETWEYWGEAKSAHNLAILNGVKLLARQRFKNGGESAPTLALTQLPTARL